jgi:hypothetical protein
MMAVHASPIWALPLQCPLTQLLDLQSEATLQADPLATPSAGTQA